MASMKEIREHIASIQSTQKVTNAMYLIASTKMRRARSRARTSTGATRTIWPSREHTPILW